MNWTEGALARHTKGGGRTFEAAKQKRHFAKIRSGVLDAQKPDLDPIPFLPRRQAIPSAPNQRDSPAFHELTSSHFKRQLRYQGGDRLGLRKQSVQQHDHEDPFTSGRMVISTSGKRQRTADRHEQLEAKSRRLLRKGDWAGVNVQKPLPLHFPVYRNSTRNQRWGFRSKNPKGDYSPFFDKKSNADILLGRQLSEYGSTPGGSRNVRIRIGSQDIAHSNPSQKTMSSLHSGLLVGKYTPALLQQADLQQPRSQDDCRRWSHRSLPQAQHERAAPTQKRELQLQRRHERGKRKHSGQPSELLQANASQTKLYHPVPQRLSQLILRDRPQATASDAFDSTAGEIGRNPLPIVAPSEISENLHWLGMLTSAEDRLVSADQQYQSEVICGPQISPGISDLPELNRKIAHEHQVDHQSIDKPSAMSLSGVTLSQMEYETSDHDISEDKTSMSLPGASGNSYEDHPLSNSPLPSSPPVREAETSLLSATQNSDDSEEMVATDGIQDLSDTDLSSEETFEIDIQKTTPAEDREAQQEQSCVHVELNPPADLQKSQPRYPAFSLRVPQQKLDGSVPATEAAFESTEIDWMDFIFGGGIDEAQDAALELAKSDAARDIRPSSSAAENRVRSPGTSSLHNDEETMATCGTGKVVRLKDNEENLLSRAFSPDSQFGLPGSNPFPPAFSPDSELGPSTIPPRARDSYVITSDLHSQGDTVAVTTQSCADGTSDSIVINTSSISNPQLETASIAAQPPTSEVGNEPTSMFKFARPKTFVGRLVASSAQRPTLHVSPNILKSSEKRGRGRPKGSVNKMKKKDTEGYTNIRALPNYVDDPIEGSD